MRLKRAERRLRRLERKHRRQSRPGGIWGTYWSGGDIHMREEKRDEFMRRLLDAKRSVESAGHRRPDR